MQSDNTVAFIGSYWYKRSLPLYHLRSLKSSAVV